MAENRNPYAPPTAHVADPLDIPHADSSERFISKGRLVPAGRGAAWIGDAWRLFRARPGKWLLVHLIFILVLVVASWIPFASVFNGILGLFIVAGIMAAADSLRRTGNFELDALFAGLRKPAPLLVIGAWVMLTLVAFYALIAIGASFKVANQVVLNLGGPVEIDPGWVFPPGFALAMLIYLAVFLPITAATYFALPLILFHDLPAGTAMKMSLIASIKNILPGAVYSVCMFLFIVVSIIPIGLGLLISVPVLMLTTYTMYRDIFIDGTSGGIPGTNSIQGDESEPLR